MQIVPTKDPSAKRDGDTITVELQKDVSLSLTLNQALRLYHTVKWQAVLMLDETAKHEPEDAQVITFPVHATRRAAQ